jgi:hypothetical protein
MAWYRQGTATVALNATAVAGVGGTAWLSQAKAGDGITFNGGATWYEIASVSSNVALTLATPFLQATVTSGAYAIDRRSPSWTLSGDLAIQVADMIARSARFNSGTGAPSNSLGVDGDYYVRSDVPTIYGPKVGGVWPAGTPWQGGFPIEGTAGQIAEKTSDANYVVAWASPRWGSLNYLINSRMSVNQREFAGGALAANTYGYDRWKAGASGCTVTSPVTSDTITLASGTLVQVIEGQTASTPPMWPRTALQPMTFSVSDLVGGNLNVTVGTATFTLTAGSGVRSATFTRPNSDASFSVALTPATSSVTFNTPTLELGTVVGARRPLALAQEIALCERYFMAYGGPGTNTTQIIAPAFARSASIVLAVLQFRTRMRAAPTTNLLGVIASDYRLQVAGNSVLLVTSVSPNPITPYSCQFAITPASTVTPGSAGSFAFNGQNARITLNAEL